MRRITGGELTDIVEAEDFWKKFQKKQREEGQAKRSE